MLELLPWKMALLPRLEILIVPVTFANVTVDEWDQDALRNTWLDVGVKLTAGSRLERAIQAILDYGGSSLIYSQGTLISKRTGSLG